MSWSGPGYLDTNWGARPLEADFSRWDWCRAPMPDSSDKAGAAILYNATRREAGEQSLALRVSAAGAVEPFAPPPRVALKPTLWRVPRATRADAGQAVTVRQTLEDAKLEKDEIDEVVLVGGMTRMPRIQSAVAGFFEREPNKGVHPDEVVALGAAIQGSALTDDKQEMILLDVTPHALGIMTFGSVFEELIPQNTTVPTHRQKIFTTSRDNQTAVKIIVMQGENEDASANELLGEFILTGLRRAPKGTVEIEVTFEINADGIVSVRAKDLDTGLEQSIQVTASSGLTRDEIKDMIDASKDDLVDRRTSEDFEAAKQEAEKIVAEIERLFPQVEQIVASSDFGRDAIEKARAIVEKARAAIAKKDTAAVKEQLDGLTRTHRMFKGVVAKT